MPLYFIRIILQIIIDKLASYSYWACLLAIVLGVNIAQGLDCKPFGVRLNFGTKQRLAIRFNTKVNCPKSYITVQKSSSSIRKIYCDNFVLSFDNYTSYVHKCPIVDVSHGDTIGYMVIGWTGNATDPQIPYLANTISYYFPKNSEDFKMVSLADWSYLRQFRTKYKPLDQSFEYLLKTDPSIRAIFINGDVAYDLQSNNGRNYEDFLNMISQVTIKWPLIINPGNHEHRDNNLYVLNNSFETYGIVNKRVAVLKLPWFNLIIFDPYQILYNKEPQNKSYGPFRKQLEESYQSKNLTVLASHYPFRCNGEAKDCETKHIQMSQFFAAMFEMNVPLYLGAHFHAYERHYPFKADGLFIKTSQVQWEFDRKPQDRRLISVVQGVAGNDLSMVENYDQLRQFTAAYSYNVTGYAIVKVGELRLSYSHYTSNNPSTPVDFFEMFLKRYPKKQLRTQ